MHRTKGWKWREVEIEGEAERDGEREGEEEKEGEREGGERERERLEKSRESDRREKDPVTARDVFLKLVSRTSACNRKKYLC